MLHHKDQVWIHKREGRDIWENLNQPLMIEAAMPLDSAQLMRHETIEMLSLNVQKLNYEGSLKQRLTHQLIESRFFSVNVKSQPESLPGSGRWVPLAELKNIALPKTLVTFFTDKGII